MGCGRPTHIISKNKQIQIWYHQLAYVSNAIVVRASKLVNGININNAEYNPEEMFIDSDLSETNKQSISSKQNIVLLTA